MKRYSIYKDSGVKWIGEIPSYWNVTRLRFLGTTQNGISKSGDYFWSGFPFVTYGDVYNNTILKIPSGLASSTKEDQLLYSVEKGDIFFTRTSETIDEIGFSCVCLETIQQAIFSGFLIRFRPFKNELDTKFAAYYFRSKIHRNYFSKNMNIVIRASLGQTLLKNLPVLLPLLSEQQAIVSYLDTKVSKIDSYIVIAEKKIAALDELKQVTITDTVTHGINPNVSMKDSGIPWIGKVPEHWKVKRTAIMFSENKNKNSKYELSHAFKFNYGTLVPKNETGDLSEYRDTYEAYTIIKKDDIAINCLNLNYDFVSQRVAISPNKGILTSAYLIITPRQGINPYYYNYLFKAMDYRKLFHGMGTGIRLTLSYTELKKQFLPTPPLTEQDEIVAYLNRKVAQIEKMRASELAQIEKLKEYKQRLISDVVTGKVKVTND